jgi:hypothetical protein
VWVKESSKLIGAIRGGISDINMEVKDAAKARVLLESKPERLSDISCLCSRAVLNLDTDTDLVSNISLAKIKSVSFCSNLKIVISN